MTNKNTLDILNRQTLKTEHQRLNINTAQNHKKLESPNLKIGIISDIHANLQALEKVFEDAEKKGVTIFLNAGDSIGFGANPNEVLELLREKNVISILGNFDLEVLNKKTKVKGEKEVALQFTRKELTKSCQHYLCSFPLEQRFEVAGKKLLIVHGSPRIHLRTHLPKYTN